MVLVCWLQDYITKADPSESELCEGLAKCGGTNPSLPRVGIARPESLPEFVCASMSRRHFNEQRSQKPSEMRYDLGHKTLFARVFWPKGVNSVPFPSLGRRSSSKTPARRNRRRARHRARAVRSLWEWHSAHWAFLSLSRGRSQQVKDARAPFIP